jgi:hypothetical protein
MVIRINNLGGKGKNKGNIYEESYLSSVSPTT